MREGDQVYNFGIGAYTHIEHNTSRKHLLAGNEFTPLPRSCLSRPRNCLKDLFAIPEFLWVYLKQCLPKAGLIWESDPYCPRLDQTQGWSHGSPTVPAMPPFDSRRPKSFKCRADFERRHSSGKEAGTCWELTFSGEKQCPTFRKGGEYLHITPGATRRLWQQVWGHSGSQMVMWMQRSGLHLPSSCLMHHTYEVMEARGRIQREFSPLCKVPADTLHCVTAGVHNKSAHSPADYA